MAISSTTVWECRSNATGSMLNGGGFNPSNSASNTTDYSQQTAAQYNFTDLASTNGTTNPAVVTSASHSFVTSDVGNIIHITAGTSWTTGWYEIKSVSSGAATLDRACGSSATLSGGTYYVGGALDLTTTLANTWSQSATFLPAGSTVYIKSGNYTAGTVTWATGIQIIGYNSTRTDNPIGNNRPKLTGAGFATQLANGRQLVKNIRFETTSGNPTSTVIMGLGTVLKNCSIINASSNSSQIAVTFTAAGSAQVFGSLLYDCEIACTQSSTGVAIQSAAGSMANIVNCYIHDSYDGVQCAGLSSSYAHVNVINCVFANCKDAAIIQSSASANSHMNVIGNTIYGNESKDNVAVGVSISSVTGGVAYITNNIFYGLGVAITTNSTNPFYIVSDYNSFYNNTTNFTNVTQGANDITATNPSFTNAGFLSGSTATTSGGILTQTGADFSTVTDNQDYLRVISGTGVVAGCYLITAHTTTTVTLSPAPGNNAVADKVWNIVTGRNWAIGTGLRGAAPVSFPQTATTSYIDIGAAQRSEGTSAYTDPGIANVRSGTGYTYNGASQTGTLDLPAISDVKSGVVYDNTTKTGTYDPITGNYTDPGIANVKSGVSYVFAGSTLNGTLASGGGALIAGGLMRR